MNGNPTKAVVFTDLDGTLLNEKYEYTETQPVVEQLLALNVPVVLCSSKTSAEIQHFQEALNLRDPFISENGAAIFIPEKYFSQDFSYSRQTAGFKVIEFGTGYERLRQTLEKVRADSGAEVVGFGDLSAEEVAEECGLSPQMARLAKKREYDEPFRIVKGDSTRVVRMMEKAGLSVTKGDRYYHLTEDNNKGKAVALLTQLYKKAFGHVWTFGVGNGPNDFEMLRVVDKPLFVQQTDRLQDVWVEILREVRRLNLQAQD